MVKEKQYRNLKEKSKEINNGLTNLLEKKNKSQEPIKVPNAHYLIVNINPSDSKSKTKTSAKALNKWPYMCTLGRLLEYDKETDFKNLKNKIYWPRFFNKPFKLIQEIDKKVTMFWENGRIIDSIVRKVKGLVKSKVLKKGAIKEIKKLKEKYKQLPRIPNAHKVVFAELIYFKDKNQKNIENVITKNNHLKKEIIEFFRLQLDYYNPKVILITNKWASKFIEENYAGYFLEKKTGKNSFYKTKDGRVIVLAPTLVGRRAIDEYSYRRLKKQLESIIKK